MKLLIANILVISLSSCGVVYKGKFGTYTASPSGVIIIEPAYAK
jgi:hypothetical protein